MDDEANEHESVPSQVLTRGDMAYLMRRRGMSLSDIADELHIDRGTASKLISKRLGELGEKRTDEERQDILQMENDRLDYYLSKLWPSIEYGDVKAITAALAIHDRKMKANQLDRPDANLDKSTILVIGGQEDDYVEKLKALANHG